MEAVVQKIAEEVKDKRYLIVLDDLWNEEEDDWNAFKNSLAGASSNEGNVIIVTTRKEEVASIVNTCNCPYRFKSLTDKDCWSVIRAMIFQDKQVPKQFEITGIEIAGKCRGLPLAANIVGRVLQGKGREEWLEILRNRLSDLQKGENGVLQVLKLWMAEGFLPDNPASDKENIGNTFFNILLQNFFFQEPEKDKYGNIICCKMHDLVHDLACSVSKSESFMNVEDHNAGEILRVRHLATKSIGGETHNEIKEKARYFRTLFLASSVPHEILPHFKHLHVLKLCDEILRYLDVSHNDGLTTLPESVCKLYNLQTLRILTNSFQRLPEDLQFLIHLRHLNFDNVVDDFEMPPEIRRLSFLQSLPLFCASDKEGRRIDELGELMNLKGTLRIRNLVW